MSVILNEKEYVEEPLLRQLEVLGWTVIRAGETGKYDPEITLRESFSDVVLEKELKAALLSINPWLEEDQLPELVREITTPSANSLLEANQEILARLLENSSADNRKTGQKSDTVRFIDFSDIKEKDKHRCKNRYLAISQFKVKIPGTEKHIIPDIVLFINGIPVVVIECKSPSIADSMGEAIIQLLRYQNRRGETAEGNPKLFYYNQFMVATNRQMATYSTITGEFEHFIEWKDPYPFALSEIETAGESVTSYNDTRN